MTRLRRLAVVLAALAVVGTTIPTGGFTSASAERGVSVDVVPDEDALLGVEIREVWGADDRKTISFVGFCTVSDTDDVGAEADVTKYKQEVTQENATDEALAVEWATEEQVSTVVLKTGGGNDAFESVPVDESTSGEVEVTGTKDEGIQSPSDYCPGSEHETAKLDLDGDVGVAGSADPVGGRALKVTIESRLPASLTTVNATARGTTLDLADRGRESLAPGDSVTFRFDGVGCETVEVVAAGNGVRVTLERSCS